MVLGLISKDIYGIIGQSYVINLLLHLIVKCLSLYPAPWKHLIEVSYSSWKKKSMVKAGKEKKVYRKVIEIKGSQSEYS